jgi:hypothetical protein
MAGFLQGAAANDGQRKSRQWELAASGFSTLFRRYAERTPNDASNGCVPK